MKENQESYELNTMKFEINNIDLLDTPVCKTLFYDTTINLKNFLSKEKIIENQCQLNLKLMKWRLEPDLDIEMISSQKFFILGTGTLGCNMARLLIGYGAKNITFLDYGYVSYSNLARQSLFNLDCFDKTDKGISKVEAAKLNLLKISPGMNI